METIWTAAQPHIIELLGVLLTLLIGIATQALRRWTGIEIEARHREALHSAIMSGVEAAMAHGAGDVQTVKRAAIEHANASVPDAIRALVRGDTVLDTLAERYARQKLASLGR